MKFFIDTANLAQIKEAQDLGLKIYWSHTIVDTHGYKRLKQISIMELSKDGQSFANSNNNFRNSKYN